MGAVRRFAAAGGSHLFLATQNYRGGPLLDIASYVEQFDQTERLARRAAEEAAVVAFPVLAPYPIDLVRASQQIGLAPAVELHRRALELAGQRVREHRAVALGEVGRPHFPVEDSALAAASESLFDYALEVARECGCPAVVHCEDLDTEGFEALAARGRRLGIPAEHVVKHYARSRFLPRPGEGPVRSYLARRDLVAEVLPDEAPWFLETDFLDDPARPGAVLDLATVPKRALWVATQHPDQVERLRVPFVESVRRVYGLSLRARGG